MVNRLPAKTQEQVIAALVEGASIRSVERMTGVHRDTIMRLLVRVGKTCEAVMDETMRDLPLKRLEVDEIWTFVGKKQRHVTNEDNLAEVGDFWTWVALDAETKLVPCYRVGKRDRFTANDFMEDLGSRLANRVQVSTDGLRLYVEAVEAGFGGDVDWATIVKSYEGEALGEGRYSPPKVVSTEKSIKLGAPDEAYISTSYVERQNWTMRTHMRRLTRLSNGFSRKRENLEAAVAAHFVFYNFVRKHTTLKATPAMAAGLTDRPWTAGEVVWLAS